MPIQFRCDSCRKWLEVDDEYAGGQAVCPFCQAVNRVPGQTMARPAPGEEPKSPYTGVPTEPTRPGEPEVPVSKPPEPGERPTEPPKPFEYDQGRFDARRAGLPTPPWGRRANRLGLAGLILTLVAWGLLIAVNIVTAVYASPEFLKEMQTGKPAEQILQQHPWLLAMAGAVFLAILLDIIGFGLCLAVVVNRQAIGRGPALAGVVTGGLLLLCTCAGMIVQLAAGSLM